MYQGTGSRRRADLPTVVLRRQNGAHVPDFDRMNQETEPSDEDELFLDAELFGDDEEEIRSHR